MNRILFSFFILTLLSSCGNGLETIEVKEDGVVVEEYTRRTSDFAKEGILTRFSPTGVIYEKSEYQNDKLSGTQRFFFPNGKIQEEVNYINGNHEGEYKTFFEDGKIKQEGQYKAGAMSGEWKGYHPNGKLKEVVIFENNQEQGPFKEYHPNGNLKTEGFYGGTDPDTGFALEHNELKKYDEQGEIYQIMDCTNGRCLTTWKKEGVELTED